MARQKYTVVGLGELLRDMLPSGKQLGGAPANFAYITHLLGDVGLPASRVGCDSLGDEALLRLSQLGLSAEFIQRDPKHPTGTVKVKIASDGQPRFDISGPAAWDFLEWSSAWQHLARKADAVCFGSLAQRSTSSRATIRSFLQATRPGAVRIFDVNLRQNFYSSQVLKESMSLATVVKLNHEELPRLMSLCELDGRGEGVRDEEAAARHLLSSYGLKLICVTRGEGGSLLVSCAERSEHPGFKVKVADTVGAGDAFTAALVHGYLRGLALDQVNETANKVGAWVATQSGATPAAGRGGLARALAEIE
jgi:fructokinase